VCPKVGCLDQKKDLLWFCVLSTLDGRELGLLTRLLCTKYDVVEFMLRVTFTVMIGMRSS
jgi:hypothetical protein